MRTRETRWIVLAAALVVTMAPRTWAACGDGVVDGGEQCDLAAGNGSSTTCCTTLCEFRAEDTVCRPAANACDLPELCTGVSDTCPPDLVIAEGASCDDGTPCTADDRCSAGICSGTPTPDTCIDDFTCYRVRTTSGTQKFAPIGGVHLEDAFEIADVSVVRPKLLCLPADKNTEGTLDAVTHVEGYVIRAAPGSPRHVRQTDLKIDNQIGSLHVDTVRPELLMVPTAKSLVSQPLPPDPQSHRVDHYKCYRIRTTRGMPRFPKGVTVSITDQFSNSARTLRLKRPRHLCIPVDKNSEGFKNPPILLMCYQARGTPPHQRRVGLFVNNQFGPERLDTVGDSEICIPSARGN